MRRISNTDASFFYADTRRTPSVVGALMIYDQSTAKRQKVRFKDILTWIEDRLHLWAPFRQRLVRVPFDLDLPYLADDPNFDVEFHVHHLSLPKPGDWRQLCILVSRLHARPLDMSRPLWEAYIIEGLDNIVGVPKGAFAIYTKMHHSLVDGAGGASFMSAIHDLEADPKPFTERTTITVDTPPSPAYLATTAAVNQVKNSFKMARGAVGLARDLGKLALGVARKEIPMPSISAPKTRFNNPVGPYRAFDAAEFALDDIKLIKNAVNGKINDVVLAIVSGAMRRYLESINELPEESLAVSIPLNMRTRRAVTEDNNQIGSVFLDVHTNIKDPIERIKAIMASADEAKRYGEASPLVDVLKVTGMFSPALTKPFVNLYINNQLSKHMPANITGVVSNVAGPPFPLYSAGAKMVRYYGMGLLTPGMGMFNLAFSADGVVTLSILADRDTMPNPALYRDFMYETFEELREAALRLQAGEKAPIRKSASSTITPIAGAVAKKPGATVAKPKAPPRKAKAVKTAKPASAKLKSNGAAAAKSAEVKKSASSAQKKTAKAKPTAKAVVRQVAKPPAKAPVQKAKASNGKAEPIKSLFAETGDSGVAASKRGDAVVH